MADVSAAAADPQRPLLEYYDERLRRHGDTAAGAGWPNDADRRTRFAVLTEALRRESGEPAPVVCDLGCGTGELLGWLRAVGRRDIGYIGADRSALALGHAAAKFPEARWVEIDVMSASTQELDALRCDWLVACGLFTVRHSLSNEAMWRFLEGTLERLWPRVRRGIAFNVMSPVVDWEREDLFHASHDRMAQLLHRLAGRHVQMRADYGLYEYACLAVKPGAAAAPPGAQAPAPLARVPAYRPRLPDAACLAPYLRRIDATRVYSNHGPLVAELERRLGAALGLAPQQLVCAASGTAALVAGILATAGRATPERPYALCPAYTFVGTASALQQCGYVPWLVDVDAETWQMDAQALRSHAQLAQVGVVVPVSPYGAAVALQGWEDFQAQTGIPVVVDAAAAIESLWREGCAGLGRVPVALSFHATKAFAVGEGGALLVRDEAVARRAFETLNFGFLMDRVSRTPSINGKMAELPAAQGLSSLDAWPVHHAALCAVADAYRAAFAHQALAELLVCHPQVASNYALLRLPDADAAQRVTSALDAAGVDSRLWYGLGLHRQPALVALPSDELVHCDRIASCILGLPVAPDLAPAQIDRIAGIVARALRR